MASTETLTGERADLLAMLAKHRYFLTFPTRGLTDDQARERPTASELCLGGLIKHVTSVERGWANFLVEGASAMGNFDEMTEDDFAKREAEFKLLPHETLAGVIADYEAVARRTDELVATVDLDAVHELPKAPWFTDKAWSNRRVLMHIVAETAQHAGHADIIRESLDGQKSMG
ncbi:DinB family protein [Amycolatopsis endophytica]|uniref:Putative damage-inducible protein DinB n=1 Tax=Amycolatopsis endophytica TaxID=860233 RepID=A0A853B1M9_9PSEU|nr:DinB family protein [Amycolatopsis endophytica]NYI88737.1 putative damage-inducible protein DinB [Amycolatopsis endophytica]